MRPLNERPQIPQSRKLFVIAALVAVVLGIVELITGKLAIGVLLVAVGSVTLGGVLRQLNLQRRGRDSVSSYQVMKAYAFFVGCSVGGAALIVLAVLGLVHEPVLLGFLGLVASGGGTFMVVDGLRARRKSDR
ncbi:MAG TPA: hypothetical protein VN892_12785 [Solirubrobacteraceae bacterium]|nr:hypothetical protein [Solirubrobacteraceae bacterium]